jgi:hypothetical protein
MEPVNVKNLRRILEGIWGGELEHDQRHYFCGTKCCVAGWDVALNSGIVAKPSERAMLWLDGLNEAYDEPDTWSKNHNKLTGPEANLLFSARASKKLHELVLAGLEAGRRLTASHLLMVCDDNAYEISDISIFTNSPGDLRGFLGITEQPTYDSGYNCFVVKVPGL